MPTQEELERMKDVVDSMPEGERFPPDPGQPATAGDPDSASDEPEKRKQPEYPASVVPHKMEAMACIVHLDGEGEVMIPTIIHTDGKLVQRDIKLYVGSNPDWDIDEEIANLLECSRSLAQKVLDAKASP